MNMKKKELFASIDCTRLFGWRLKKSQKNQPNLKLHVEDLDKEINVYELYDVLRQMKSGTRN